MSGRLLCVSKLFMKEDEKICLISSNSMILAEEATVENVYFTVRATIPRVCRVQRDAYIPYSLHRLIWYNVCVSHGNNKIE